MESSQLITHGQANGKDILSHYRTAALTRRVYVTVAFVAPVGARLSRVAACARRFQRDVICMRHRTCFCAH